MTSTGNHISDNDGADSAPSTGKRAIEPATGKLGVLLVGLGAVSTTFIAGVFHARRNKTKAVGSLTQMGTIRLGKRTDNRSPLIKDLVPLASLDDLEFAAWDIFEDNALEAARKSGVLSNEHLHEVADELAAIKPMKAVFNRDYVKRLDGPNVKEARSKMALASMLVDEIQQIKISRNLDRMVMVWCASTETFVEPGPVHESVASFEAGLERNDPAITSSMIYAYAALKSGVPFANGAPNLTVDIKALQELAHRQGMPICGKDFKTGQTLMKTILAPGLRARQLGIRGWFSTNILGNRDGEVLDDPGSFKTKEESKLSVLDTILQPELNPELYGDLYHKVRINYYPPHGDNKEGWDNIDIFGWMNYPMQIKVNFLCRDSILAAPIVLDLALFSDLAQRAGMSGIQEWLSFYFKAPMVGEGLYPEHNLFIQGMKLKNTLRVIMGETEITHTGLDYYDM